jgi:hemin uptake protein HemP
MSNDGRPPPARVSPPPSTAPVARISSAELMRQQRELIIEHDGREYRLRVTHNGKLILTA